MDLFAPQHILLILIFFAIPILLLILLIRFLINRGGKVEKNSTNISVADELEKLSILHEKGIITKEELEISKSKLL